jgi:hypothetical protein
MKTYTDPNLRPISEAAPRPPEEHVPALHLATDTLTELIRQYNIVEAAQAERRETIFKAMYGRHGYRQIHLGGQASWGSNQFNGPLARLLASPTVQGLGTTIQIDSLGED